MTITLELPGILDLTVISFLERVWIEVLGETLPTPADNRTTAMQLLSLVFDNYTDEVPAGPRKLNGLCGSYILCSD